MSLQIGALHVRRSIFIDALPSRVWEEFATHSRVAAWLSHGHVLHTFESRAGGRVEFSVAIGGIERRFGGRVVDYAPPQGLSLEINWHDPDWATPVPNFWTFRLTPLYGGTHVELFHHGFERLGRDAALTLQGFEQGWDVKHLVALRAIVEG